MAQELMRGQWASRLVSGRKAGAAGNLRDFSEVQEWESEDSLTPGVIRLSMGEIVLVLGVTGGQGVDPGSTGGEVREFPCFKRLPGKGGLGPRGMAMTKRGRWTPEQVFMQPGGLAGGAGQELSLLSEAVQCVAESVS